MITVPTISAVLADDLWSRGVRRIYGLCGGHIQPLWDAAARRGIEIVDVRHEGSAVLMAQAEAQLTGSLAVALVTAGPGLTNAMTGIANAHASQAPVLVLAGHPPRPQAGRGAMQELPQIALVAPICRYAGTLLLGSEATATLDAAIRAALGAGGSPGPACIDLPTDLLDEPAAPANGSRVHAVETGPAPDPAALDAARLLIERSRRPLLISGRGAVGAAAELDAFLAASGALYLDSGESRSVLPVDHPAAVPARRGQAMREADLVITLGRRLNFQLGYGSPAVLDPDARLLRIGTSSADTSDNRAGDVELHADAATALAALTALGAAPDDPDVEWATTLREANALRVAAHREAMRTRPPGADGRMHPDRLVSALNEHIGPDTITVADGGDILSFARVGLASRTYLDCGPLGCLGVGVPFATAAALAFPERRVLAVIGDGSFGFTAIELDTAVRHGARAVFVIANNEAWNIERNDQRQRYESRFVGVDLPGCRYDVLAQGLGASGRRVTHPDELPEAIEWAFAHAPAVLDVLVTRDAESADFRSGLAQVPARHALTTWDQAEAALERAAVASSPG